MIQPISKISRILFCMWIGLIIIFYELNMRRNILLYFCVLISIDLVCERKKKSLHVYVRVCVCVCLFVSFMKSVKNIVEWWVVMLFPIKIILNLFWNMRTDMETHHPVACESNKFSREMLFDLYTRLFDFKVCFDFIYSLDLSSFHIFCLFAFLWLAFLKTVHDVRCVAINKLVSNRDAFLHTLKFNHVRHFLKVAMS